MLLVKVVKSLALRRSAKGEKCTVNIAGVCNYDSETVVLAHLPSDIAGSKATDLSSCYACAACHDVIDRRRGSLPFEMEREFYMRRAMVRTWTRFVEKGLIEVTQ